MAIAGFRGIFNTINTDFYSQQCSTSRRLLRRMPSACISGQIPSVSCLHRFAELGQDSQCSPPVNWRHSATAYWVTVVRFMSAAAAGSSCKFRVIRGSRWRRTRYDEALPCLLTLSGGVQGRTPGLSHLHTLQRTPHAAAGRFEQFSLVENLVLKIIPKKYPVNHFKEKTKKKCSGAI